MPPALYVPRPAARRSAAAPTDARSRAAHPNPYPYPYPNQASICSSMAIPGSVPLLKGAAALTGTAVALPFGSF